MIHILMVLEIFCYSIGKPRKVWGISKIVLRNNPDYLNGVQRVYTITDEFVSYIVYIQGPAYLLKTVAAVEYYNIGILCCVLSSRQKYEGNAHGNERETVRGRLRDPGREFSQRAVVTPHFGLVFYVDFRPLLPSKHYVGIYFMLEHVCIDQSHTALILINYIIEIFVLLSRDFFNNFNIDQSTWVIFVPTKFSE